MDAERIAIAARKSLGRYCVEECHSYCCRKGFLILDGKQAKMMSQGRQVEMVDNHTMNLIADNKYSLDLKDDCPCLKDFRCTIHKKLSRPQACKEFPLFINGMHIKLSSRCPAIKADLLYPYIHKLKMLGYSIEESGSLADSEFYKTAF